MDAGALHRRRGRNCSGRGTARSRRGRPCRSRAPPAPRPAAGSRAGRASSVLVCSPGAADSDSSSNSRRFSSGYFSKLMVLGAAASSSASGISRVIGVTLRARRAGRSRWRSASGLQGSGHQVVRGEDARVSAMTRRMSVSIVRSRFLSKPRLRPASCTGWKVTPRTHVVVQRMADDLARSPGR